jgi:hypothetical protein
MSSHMVVFKIKCSLIRFGDDTTRNIPFFHLSKRFYLISLCVEHRCYISLSLRLAKAAAERMRRCEDLLVGSLANRFFTESHSGSHVGMDIRPVLVVKGRKYDETPLPLRYSWDHDLSDNEDKADELQVAKLLVVERSWAILCQRADGRYGVLRSDSSPVTSAIESCTAESIRLQINDASKTTADELFKLSPRRVCIACTDAHPSNILAEYWLQQDTGWASLHLLDVAHKCAAIATKGLELQPQFATGAIRYALALHAPGARKSQRLAFKTILQNISIRRGHPPAEADRFRQYTLATFCSGKSKWATMQRKVASELANGDWRNADVIEHYCNGCCTSPRETVWKMQRFMRKAHLGNAVQVFSRKNFTGGRAVVNQIGIFQACHPFGRTK